MNYHHLPIKDAVRKLKTDTEHGLSSREAQKRLRLYGPNLLPVKKKPPIIYKFFAQFTNILVIILLFATVLSVFLGDMIDALAILCIVIINATIGFIQEVQSEKTLESLKKQEILETIVVRDGVVTEVPFPQLVPGDVIILEEGNKIPSDARLIESFGLRVDESILTGESNAVSKQTHELPENLSLADRTNIVYKDTKVLSGRGKAIVFATGMQTEIGKIAKALEDTTVEETPLTKELNSVGKTITTAVGAIALLVFFLNMLRSTPFVDSLLISISLAVAAIPEGLPAIVTIVLSLGVKRLAQKRSIIRKLASVETLGAVRIIATDKTGTLTENKMNVVIAYLGMGKEILIKGDGFKQAGIFFNKAGHMINPTGKTSLITLLRAGVLASNASLKEKEDEFEVIGDTTEGAILVAASRAGLHIHDIRQSEPKIFEVPFTSERKMVSTIEEVNDTGEHILYAKGAPEVILSICLLSSQKKQQLLNVTKSYSQKGLRTIAVASRSLTKREISNALENGKLEEQRLEFLGFFAMQDSLRPEVQEAIKEAKRAGIRTIMITGDHKETAASIAVDAGIINPGESILTENDIEHLTLEELSHTIRKGINVFARISPMGKLKIVEAIKTIPYMQMAVTGDGVNDAPALKASHIGIAMGKTGTDITREVADMVITDDNYATIVVAIEEGRVIFANLVKFIRYLISCNLSEVLVVSLGVFFGTPIPLLPIQILWINLITDGFPALALGVDPPEPGLMKDPPRDLSRGILHRKRWFYMIMEGSIMGAATFGIFVFALSYFDYPHAQTMAFTTLAFSQLIHAFNNRSVRKSIFSLNLLGNKPLILAFALSVLLQITILSTDWGNGIFKTIPLGIDDWTIVVCASLVPLLVVEIKKSLRFRILP